MKQSGSCLDKSTPIARQESDSRAIELFTYITDENLLEIEGILMILHDKLIS